VCVIGANSGKDQRIGFDVYFESGKGLQKARPQLRSLNLEHAHHRKQAVTKKFSNALTDFSATALGELTTSIPIPFPSASGLLAAIPTSCRNFVVASVLRSCTTSVSVAGIFARRFLAIGYPKTGTRSHVSTILRNCGVRFKARCEWGLHAR